MPTTEFRAHCPHCDEVTPQSRIRETNASGDVMVDMTTCGKCGRDDL